jgi:SOS response regulatory protein OraA/RecX
MPVKLKPSVVKIDRATKKKSIEHTYAKTQSKEELIKMLNHEYTRPKVKQKIRNELVRRGYQIVYVPRKEV